MAPSNTVPAIKAAFLNDQVRILSQPLEIPPGYESQSTIPSKYVHQALKEFADVAQQIDYLYWNSIQPHHTDSQDVPLRTTDNMTLDQNISRLSEDLVSADQAQVAFDRLKDLAERRKVAQQKLVKYRALQKELAILKNPETMIQPNLASKDGPLAEELSRVRRLATKLAGKVAGSKRAHEADQGPARPSKAIMMDEDERLQSTLRELG